MLRLHKHTPKSDQTSTLRRSIQRSTCGQHLQRNRVIAATLMQVCDQDRPPVHPPSHNPNLPCCRLCLRLLPSQRKNRSPSSFNTKCSCLMGRWCSMRRVSCRSGWTPLGLFGILGLEVREGKRGREGEGGGDGEREGEGEGRGGEIMKESIKENNTRVEKYGRMRRRKRQAAMHTFDTLTVCHRSQSF